MPHFKRKNHSALCGFALLFFTSTIGAETYSVGQNVTTILDSLLAGYDTRVRPNFGGEPVTIGVTMYVLSIQSMDHLKMELTWDYYFRQYWKDPRLSFQGPPFTINLGGDFATKIWRPDTFMVNEKWSQAPNSRISESLVKISASGDVVYSARMLTTASCPMDLRLYPLDSQLCTLEIESFGSSMTDIRYNWTKGSNSIGVSSEVSLPEFRVLAHKIQKMEISLTTGNYSRLAAELLLSRSSGSYIRRCYIPAIAIVVLSCLAFWIHSKYFTTRMLLAIVSATFITLVSFHANNELPKISYMTAMAVYLDFCCVMVFSTLPGLMLVEYLIPKKTSNEGQEESSTNFSPFTLDEGRAERGFLAKMREIKLTSQLIDTCLKIGYPVIFLLFNIYYWISYNANTNMDWIRKVENEWSLLNPESWV